MRSADLAEARCRAYTLFGAIALDGLSPEVLEAIDAVPSLAASVDRWRSVPGGPVDLDAAAAAHFEVLSHEIFPFQSVFLSPDAAPGGAYTDRAQAFFLQAGFPFDETGPSADHIGVILQAMAFVCGAEADAHKDDRFDVVARIRRMQRELLDEHILSWWPALAEAMAFGSFPLYREWTDAVTELVLHHRDGLDAGLAPAPAVDPQVRSLPQRLANGQTRLTEIAEALLRPVEAGAFVSRGALRRLGRQDRLPGGFGARVVVLTNLLRSASTYDALDRLIGNLEGRFAAARTFYDAYAAGAPVAAAAPAHAWGRKCASTEAGLRMLRTAASGLDD